MGCIPYDNHNRVGPQRIKMYILEAHRNQILREYNIQELKNEWDIEQLKLIDSRLISNKVTKQDFIKLFPKLSETFSKVQNSQLKKTVNNIYAVFKNKKTGFITKEQFIQRLTLVQKVDDPEIMGEIIFYAYAMNKSKSTYKNSPSNEPVMNKEDLQLFLHQNKPFIQSISEENIIHQKVKKSHYICKQEFMKLFHYFHLRKYKQLFDLNLEGLETQLIDEILTKSPIKNNKNDTVYVISIYWFRKWQMHLEITYGIELYFKDGLLQAKKINKWNQPSKDTKKEVRPGPINNQPLKNPQNFGLRRDLLQNHNFYLLPSWMFVKLISIYRGGPVYKRKYPQIHSYFVAVVRVDDEAKFIPKKITLSEHEDINRPIYLFLGKNATEPSVALHACYYRYPGKEDWGIVEDLTLPISKILFYFKIYLCFVRKSQKSDFEGRYNVQQSGGKKHIYRRIKNYGTIINVIDNGKVVKAEVLEVQQNNEVVVSVENHDGSFKKMVKSVDELQAINPNAFEQVSQYNPIAGLNNLGNSCYINAVVQCIIRTPYFGKYLGKIDFNHHREKQMLLLYAIYLIYEKATFSNQTIETSHLKRVIDFHFPYLKGFAQQDAHEFLNSVLDKISEELKDTKKEFNNSIFGVKNSISQSINPNSDSLLIEAEGAVNTRVKKFFSGTNEIVTICQKCNNKNSRQEPFFTYSLALPQHRERQIYCTLIRKQVKIATKYGLTIDKKTTVNEVIRDLSRMTNISQENLLLTSIFNGQWIQVFIDSLLYGQIAPSISSNFSFVCYEVQYLTPIGFKDFLDRKLDNKSIKIEVRQRQYEGKTKTFKSRLTPMLAEITKGTTWSQIERQLSQKIYGLFRNQEQYLQRTPNKMEYQGIKGESSTFIQGSIKQSRQIMSNQNLNQTRKLQQTPRMQKQASKSIKKETNLKAYKIRLISKYPDLDGVCLLCKRRFRPKKIQTSKDFHRKNSSKRPAYCEEDPQTCLFDRHLPLIELLEFRNRIDIMLIVIDWDEDIVVSHPQQLIDDSYGKAMKRAQNRKDFIDNILAANLELKEQLELRCQKENCNGTFCQRIQRIHTIPNIFILHLKRFRYDDGTLQKLNNNVVYREQLNVKGVYYELYGVVVHLGQGAAGGHYYSYIKVDKKWYNCSDNKVKQVSSQQLIDPNVYLLFYRKTDFEPSLLCLRF